MNHVFEIIEKMRARPVLYLGENSITKLYSFLIGYQAALYDLKASNEGTIGALLPLPFGFFHEYAARCFGYFESTAGWLNMILEQAAQDEAKGLGLFYTLFDGFKQIKIEHCFAADLNEANFMFHLSSESAPRRWKGEKLDIREPLYNNPSRIYYAKLSNSATFEGYVGIIQADEGCIIERQIYKTEKDILTYFEKCFGAVAWQEQHVKNLVFSQAATIR